MRFIVVGHPARAHQAHRLAVSLDAILVMDHRGEGALANHRRALQEATRLGGHVTILEDDAQPITGYKQHLAAWVARFPGDIISNYLGTGHPRQWMQEVDDQWDTPQDHIILPKLIHAVAVTYPPGAARHILNNLGVGPADYAIGDAWGKGIIYPKRSLVDHADGEPVITGRSHRRPRRARALAH